MEMAVDNTGHNKLIAHIYYFISYIISGRGLLANLFDFFTVNENGHIGINRLRVYVKELFAK
jgi:Ca2+-binding EF-hand superfamily protein